MIKRIVFIFLFIFPLIILALPSSTENTSEAEKQLNDSEALLKQINLKIKNTQKLLAEEKKQITQLTIAENKLNEKIKNQKIILNKQVSLSYRLRDQALLQALLSQKNLNEEEKTSVYTQHLNQAQLDLTQQIKKTLAAVETARTTRLEHQATLEKLYQSEQEEQEKVSKLVQNKKAALDSLSYTS